MNLYLYIFLAVVIVAAFVWFVDCANRSADDYDEKTQPPFPVYIPPSSQKKERDEN